MSISALEFYLIGISLQPQGAIMYPAKDNKGAYKRKAFKIKNYYFYYNPEEETISALMEGAKKGGSQLLPVFHHEDDVWRFIFNNNLFRSPKEIQTEQEQLRSIL